MLIFVNPANIGLWKGFRFGLSAISGRAHLFGERA
jgi:hypothetical protein